MADRSNREISPQVHGLDILLVLNLAKQCLVTHVLLHQRMHIACCMICQHVTLIGQFVLDPW